MLLVNCPNKFKNFIMCLNNAQISPKGDYSNITYITSINATFSLAGGLNLPKIIMCHCSDGVVRKQLVKVMMMMMVLLLM